jgi:hypothetical protein
VLAIVGCLAVAGGGAGLAVWRAEGATGPPPRPPASAEGLFENLLGTSAGAQALAQGAVDRSCRPPGPQSPARARLVLQIGRAQAMQRTVLSQLGDHQAALLRVPSGSALSADLARVVGTAMVAEVSYSAWLEDLQATGCFSAPTNDLHFREATEERAGAGPARGALAAAWSAVAARFHLRSWSPAAL